VTNAVRDGERHALAHVKSEPIDELGEPVDEPIPAARWSVGGPAVLRFAANDL